MTDIILKIISEHLRDRYEGDEAGSSECFALVGTVFNCLVIYVLTC
jgi:hypothetical protein